ncbi:MAG: S-layer homology domain-containing protein [Peptostreptococcaceae bacterium]
MKFKKIATNFAVSFMVLSSLNTSYATSIKDINGHWAESTIKSFIVNNYVKGYDDNTFKPDNNVTRAEFVVILNNYFGLTKKSGQVFEDTKSHWAKDQIDIAVTNGVCRGVSDTSFNPNSSITRQEACVMVSNYMMLTDDHHEEIFWFNDIYDISSWAKDAVEGMVERGYISGYPNNTFIPKGNLTRAEAVSMLSRVHKTNTPQIINTTITTNDVNKKIKMLINSISENHPYDDIVAYDSFSISRNLIFTGKDYYIAGDGVGGHLGIMVDTETFEVYMYSDSGDFSKVDYNDVGLDYAYSLLHRYNLKQYNLFGEYGAFLPTLYTLEEKTPNGYIINASIRRNMNDTNPNNMKFLVNGENISVISGSYPTNIDKINGQDQAYTKLQSYLNNTTSHFDYSGVKTERDLGSNINITGHVFWIYSNNGYNFSRLGTYLVESSTGYIYEYDVIDDGYFLKNK